MLQRLRLERFKSFQDAELTLGPFTLLVGTNASGKSNIRDAFRFLHGVSRGYGLADILGEKYVEGGALQWAGIRGGTREVTFLGAPTFALEVTYTVPTKSDGVAGSLMDFLPSAFAEDVATYRIEVDLGKNGTAPHVVSERLIFRGDLLFDSHPVNDPPPQADPALLNVRLRTGGRGRPPAVQFANQRPVLSQLLGHPRATAALRNAARSSLNALNGMRFLDLSPDSMRKASLPGQTVLGDRGENLSSVLERICENPERRKALLQWIQELTPMDARDFEFPSDLTGRILVTLVEDNGQRTSANSASDGTLRFLAMIAAMLGPEPARFYFFEELENGIHPARLYLLLQLIEQQVRRGSIQVVASTHSPQLLNLVSKRTLEDASLTYRLKNEASTRIKRILDIPEARRVIEEQDVARLHASGWLEDAVALLEDAGAVT